MSQPDPVKTMKQEARVGERRKKLPLKWPFAGAVEELRKEALAREDFDPAVLFVWGQMMATGLLAMLKAIEKNFGMEGHKVARNALVQTGSDMAKEMVEGLEWPEDIDPTEFSSLFASWVNEVVYASVEKAQVDGPDKASFDILYCPHQSLYQAFDCRIQRYFVEGLIAGMRNSLPEEKKADGRFDVAFRSTMPSGSPTCRFELWRKEPEDEANVWNDYSEKLAQKAVDKAVEKAGR